MLIFAMCHNFMMNRPIEMVLNELHLATLPSIESQKVTEDDFPRIMDLN